MPATQTAPGQHADEENFMTKRLRTFMTARLMRGLAPEQIAHAVKYLFEVEIDPAQIRPFCRGEIAFPTQTERRQDKESEQFPADAEKEPLFTRPDSDETTLAAAFVMPAAEKAPPAIALDPSPASAASEEEREAAPATQTGHRQNAEPLQILADTVDEPTAQDNSLQALGDLVKAKLGIAPAPAAATQTGHRQDRKTPTVLTDEVKAFIVRGLARYETPTYVAASVKTHFGIEVDRRQVYAYDPAGSRPPAQRWIDLHAATRAKFLNAMAEIGVAQKIVRLRMLDRYANRADEYNQMERAAAFLAQAAKECGGFYERYQRPKAAA